MTDTTDPREGGSEQDRVELLRTLDYQSTGGSIGAVTAARCAAAIRALEAKVAEREARCVELANWWNAASADRDRLAGEVERLTNERDASNRATERQWEAASQLRAEVARLTSELAAAREDETRLLWTFIDTGIDQIGEIDIHARACEINDGEDEMRDASYLQAIREAIDAARRAGEGEA